MSKKSIWLTIVGILLVVCATVIVVLLVLQLKQWSDPNAGRIQIELGAINPYTEDEIYAFGKIEVPSGETFTGLEIRYREQGTNHYYPNQDVSQSDLEGLTEISVGRYGEERMLLNDWSEFPTDKGEYWLHIEFDPWYESWKYMYAVIIIQVIIQ